MTATVVTGASRGSMNDYGRRIAAAGRLGLAELRLERAGAMAHGVSSLSAEAVRRLGGDVRVAMRLRAIPGALHLANHHLARYGPLLGRPYVVTAHDAIRMRDAAAPAGCEPLISRPTVRDRAMVAADVAGLRRAAALVVPSRHARDELERHAGLDPAAMTVVPMGVDHRRFRPLGPLPEAGFVLAVGSEHPRKGLATLLEALALLRRSGPRPGPRLVKVGPPGSAEAPFRERTLAAIDRHGLAGRVRLVDWVADDRLPWLYAGAACLVLPSTSEGFGLPLLEAMACGTPVVTTVAGAIPEVVGAAAELVAPGDAAALAGALERVLGDRRRAEALRRRGLARAAAFSWERTAAATRTVHERVLESRRGPRGRPARAASAPRRLRGPTAGVFWMTGRHVAPPAGVGATA